MKKHLDSMNMCGTLCPRIMDAIERILVRPNQLVRPLGACLGVNLEQLKFLFLVFQQQYQYYKV